MASGLSMPVGYKNSTDGTIDNATNAMLSARMPHNFLGVDDAGLTCIIRTKGNNAGHLILRGGKNGPNYDRANVAAATELLQKEGLSAGVMIDCSHANSNKDYRRQAEVWRDVVAQHREDYKRIIGGMLESNLVEGKQALGSDPSQLKYGVSITDGCIGWEQTEELLQWAYESITPPTVAV
jgi:3-deoxy-7-phosphoheptulonate synthase